jgi:hypothetical protein
VIGDFTDADILTAENATEIDLAPAKAQAAAFGHAPGPPRGIRCLKAAFDRGQLPDAAEALSGRCGIERIKSEATTVCPSSGPRHRKRIQRHGDLSALPTEIRGEMLNLRG